MTVTSPVAQGAGSALRPPWTRGRVSVWAACAALVVATGWAMGRAHLSPSTLVGGLGDIRRLVARMLPPRFDELSTTLRLALQTFWIAVAGTFLAVVLGIPLAFLHARPTTPHRSVRAVSGAVIVACRSIPDIVFALIFVRALSIGPLPGVLAIGLHSIGMIGKLCAEAIERVDPGPLDAVRSTGASWSQRLLGGAFPQVVPAFVSTVLYRLDINIRGSVILGYVGAGGIGVALRASFGRLDYPNALGIVIIIAIIVIVCEVLSSGVRRAVLGTRTRTRTGGRSHAAVAHRGATLPLVAGGTLRPPLAGERLRLQLFSVAAAVTVVVAFWQVHISLSSLRHALPRIAHVATAFFPPDFTSATGPMVNGMVETLAIALAATALGAVLAVPVGLLAARNVAPFRWVYVVVRYLLVLWRSLPELAVAIVFVAAVGLGPFPGVMAMAVATFGLVAKLVADAAEEVHPGPRDAVVSTGSSRLQEVTSAVVPQSAPAIVGAVLYALDVNVRAASVLGIVGAGGIGFLLNRSISGLNYQVTGAILIMVFALVFAIERLSSWLRTIMT